jgi:hypothetical protein
MRTRSARQSWLQEGSGLKRLQGEEYVTAVDYEAWCQALKLGLIWGQGYTLEAMRKVSKND